VNSTIDLILPARNEAGALAWVLPRIPAGIRAIVVDNGSTDGTADVARDHDTMVVSEDRPGFGSACWAGLCAATADVVAFMDADASFDPAELHLVVDPVLGDTADLVLGARRAQTGAWPWHARTANRVLAWELRRRTGAALTDLGPMRAARREALLELDLRDRRSGWPLEMVIRARQQNWRLIEVPVTYRPRIGVSKVTGTVRGTLTAVGDMGRLLARAT